MSLHLVSVPTFLLTVAWLHTYLHTYLGKDVDYQSGPYNVTFPTGITAVSLNVPITNDNILEEDEEFTVKINNASLPENFITNTSGIATVTIRNDDGK